MRSREESSLLSGSEMSEQRIWSGQSSAPRAAALVLAWLLLWGLGCQPTLAIVLEADLSDHEPADRAQVMADAMDVVVTRLDEYGLKTRSIEMQGSDKISLRLRGGADAEEVKRILTRRGRLEFKHRMCGDRSCEDFTEEDTGLTGRDVARAYAGRHAHTEVPIVNLEFDAEGTRKFAEITQKIAGSHDALAIYLDGVELMAPSVRQAIHGGRVFIQGRDFSTERVLELARLISAGALPVPLTVVEVE